MPNLFLEGLQRPAISQNNSGLPDYSEANDGDVLQIASGEPTWGAVDGLPEITNSDEGKVLTVVGEAEQVVTYYLPEQAITLTTGQGTATGADFSGLSDGDKATLTLTIGEKTTTTEGELCGTAFAFGRSSDIDSTGAVNLSAQDVGFEVLEMSGEKTATLSISVTTEGEKTYSAEWAEPSGGKVATPTMATTASMMSALQTAIQTWFTNGNKSPVIQTGTITNLAEQDFNTIMNAAQRATTTGEQSVLVLNTQGLPIGGYEVASENTAHVQYTIPYLLSNNHSFRCTGILSVRRTTNAQDEIVYAATDTWVIECIDAAT